MVVFFPLDYYLFVMIVMTITGRNDDNVIYFLVYPFLNRIYCSLIDHVVRFELSPKSQSYILNLVRP